MIVFSHVSKTYTGGRSVLADITLHIEKGSIVSVIGSSGVGKTTLLRCINRLVDCTSGSVTVGGKNITDARGRKLRMIRRGIGMVFQHYNLVERLTVIENVLHGCLGYVPLYRSIGGWYTKEEKARASALLADIGLADYTYRRCSDLSGGQKQRVGIARALMQQPSILLCDEPVSSLDPQTAHDILVYLEHRVRQDGLTCVMNLHHVTYAKTYSDRIIGLSGGRVVFDGMPDELSDADLERIFPQMSSSQGSQANEV